MAYEIRERLRLLRGTLTKRINALNSRIDNHVVTKNDIKLLVSTHDELKLQNNSLITILIENKDKTLDEEYEKIERYDDLVLESISKAEDVLEMLKPDTNVVSFKQETRSNTARLPKIEIKPFDGNILEYVSFKETFESAIDKNSSLSTIDKFNYLRSLLKGKASVSIEGLSVSAESYADALEILEDRYGDKQMIIRSHVKCLIRLEPVTNIPKFVDFVESHIRSLTTLKVPVQSYELFLTQMILEKLPSNLCIKFADENETEDQDRIRPLLDFLRDQSKLSEYACHFSGDKGKSNYFISPKRAVVNVAQFSAKNANLVCSVCGKSDHFPSQCNELKNITVEERKNVIKSKNLCYNCLKHHQCRNCESKSRCKECGGKHHTLLHNPSSIKPSEFTDAVVSKTTTLSDNQLSQFTGTVMSENPTLLGTAKITTVVNNDKKKTLRLLFDIGSQVTLIKSSISRELNSTSISNVPLKLFGVAGEHNVTSKRKVKIQLNVNGKDFAFAAYECDNICRPFQGVNVSKYDIGPFMSLPLSDDYSTQRDIDILVGADNYYYLTTGQVKTLSSGHFAAVETIFNTWALVGELPTFSGTIQNDCQLDDKLQQLIEYQNDVTAHSNEELNSESFIENNISFVNDIYQVKLPWKNMSEPMEDNYYSVESRFKRLLRKLKSSPLTIQSYHNVLKSYLVAGFIEKVSINRSQNRIRYLPHRPVIKESSDTTKVRPVFDASAKDSSDKSLNDFLFKGPNLLSLVLDILMRFRTGKYAITADIEKAYMHIEISEEDRDATRFLWLNLDDDDVKNTNESHIYRFKRLPFGLNAAPFILSTVLQKHLRKYVSTYPEIVQTLLKSMYMDDLITSLSDDNKVQEYCDVSQIIFNEAGMNMCKWRSNHDLLQKDSKLPVPVLGVSWNVDTDEIHMNLPKHGKPIKTKRELLSYIASVWDPYGILIPYTFQLKICMQKTWMENIHWDDILSDEILKDVNTWFNQISCLSTIKVPRWIKSVDDCKGEIIGFSDASTKAMASVIYYRVIIEGEIKLSFVRGKMRLAPKATTLTLPRLELNALLMTAELLIEVQSMMKLNVELICYSDSKVALAWCHGKPERWTPYVSNRVKRIQEYNQVISFKFVPGKSNPADIGTRNYISNAQKINLWLSGPNFLFLNSNNDFEYELLEAELPEKRLSKLVGVMQAEPLTIDLNKYSSFTKVLHVTCYIQRFINNCRKQCTYGLNILPEELAIAEKILIKQDQKQFFLEEYDCLINRVPLTKTSIILTLSPFLDESGIIRLTGRLQQAELTYNEKHPILLSNRSKFTELLVMHTHRRLLHASARDILLHLRCNYWILKGKRTIKSILYNNCMVCIKKRATSYEEVMAPLPNERVNIVERPFENTGIDFFGPLYSKELPSDKPRKLYGLLFTCLTTRALNLELTYSMKLDSTYAAIERFFARRGISKEIKSDNAKSFKFLQQRLFDDYRTKWSFITEKAPWHGGAWERMVQAVKSPLKTVVNKKFLSYEQLFTLFCKIEALVNSRPLTYFSEDLEDNLPLTPAHFIVGQSLTKLPIHNPDLKNNDNIQKIFSNRDRNVKTIFQRWKNEYLKFLMLTNKWQRNFQIKVDDIVLIKNDKSKEEWPLGRVSRLCPGIDGLVRTVYVRSRGIELRRPIQCLYRLEFSPSPLGNVKNQT